MNYVEFGDEGPKDIDEEGVVKSRLNLTMPGSDPVRCKWIRQTCSACPSQWEGELEDGRFFYGRYRYGVLTVETGPTIDEAVCGDLLFLSEIGGQYSGDMGTFAFWQHVRNVMLPPEN